MTVTAENIEEVTNTISSISDQQHWIAVIWQSPDCHRCSYRQRSSVGEHFWQTNARGK